MTLSFDCPNCGKKYRRVKRSLIGKKARCSCGNLIRIGGSDLPNGDDDFDKPNLPASVSDIKRTSTSPSKRRVPTVDVEVKRNLVIDDHYNDLEELLAAGGYEDDTELDESSAGEIAVPQGLLETPDKAKSSSGSSLALIAAIAAATIGFWFGLVVVLSRFTEFDQILLAYFQQTFGGIISGSFADEEVATGHKLGFVTIGWTMWILGLAMLVMAIGQLINALVKLFRHKQLFGWADGWMATLSIVFVFLVVGSLFLHASHMSALHRELNQIVPVGTPEELVPTNVLKVREQYTQRNTTFLSVMLISGAIPLAVFALSMVRLLTKSGDASHSGVQ